MHADPDGLHRADVTNANKAKGDRYEREAVAVLCALAPDLVLPHARRKLGAGRHDDVGDLDAIDGVAVQVRFRSKVADAIRTSADDAVIQAERAGARLGVGMVPILRAPRDGVAARWLAASYRWPCPVPDAAPVFGTTARAVTWIRTAGTPLAGRVAVVRRVGFAPITLGTIEAWVAALREDVAAVVS